MLCRLGATCIVLKETSLHIVCAANVCPAVGFALQDVYVMHVDTLGAGRPTGEPRSKIALQFWSGIRESNSRLKLGKLAYYHCTNPAYRRF